jgi:hypothetical protein
MHRKEPDGLRAVLPFHFVLNACLISLRCLCNHEHRGNAMLAHRQQPAAMRANRLAVR